MARKNRAEKRKVLPDPKHKSELLTRFINKVLITGKRATAEAIVYGAFDVIQERVKDDGMKVFKKAIENVTPFLEVKSRRIGGANYQVPIEVKNERGQALASRWIIEASRSRGEHTMRDRLANELIEASESRGGAFKKREDTHRMAEANKAFSHFRW